MIVFETRACAILFNVLRTRNDRRPWLLPANICPSVPETFASAEQPFELIDLDETTLEIDIRACRTRIAKSPCGGVLLARAYGSGGERVAAIESLRSAQADLFVVDDRCLDRPDLDVDLTADLTLFSTGAKKYVDLGEGGFGIFAAATRYERFLPLPSQSWDEYRSRMLDARVAADATKASLNAIYAASLPAAIQLPAPMQQWRFNILVDESEALVASIFDAGLFASRHYAPGAGDFPVAQKLHARVVNLFNDHYFDEERARRIVEVIHRHLERLPSH